MELEIILPAVSDEPLCDMLIEITKAIDEMDSDAVAHGFLGGQHGYGAQWSNPVFEMRPFYWGDCDCGANEREDAWCKAHSHADDCYRSELRRELLAAGGVATAWDWVDHPAAESYDGWNLVKQVVYAKLCEKHGLPMQGYAVHCTCSYDTEWKAWVADNGHTSACSLELPNFRHHASGLEVRWYKYIGRGMEAVNVPADLSPILAECLTSLA